MTTTALASAKENNESVIAMAPAKPDGTRMMLIHVLESGEELDHKPAHALADPREA